MWIFGGGAGGGGGVFVCMKSLDVGKIEAHMKQQKANNFEMGVYKGSP